MASAKRNNRTSDQRRLKWVLASLVASMTLGTLVLGVLEPKRALSSEVSYLAATYNDPLTSKITDTELPIEPRLWNAIVIHSTTRGLELPCLREQGVAGAEAHFAVRRDGKIVVGRLWKQQQSLAGQWGRIQIAVEVDRNPQATLPQAQHLVSLIMELQARCQIRPQQVYLHSQVSSGNCPGPLLRRYSWRGSLLGLGGR